MPTTVLEPDLPPGHRAPTPHGHVAMPVPYIPDGARVRLNDGTTGTVWSDLGGPNAPVYIDGQHDPSTPHDYTTVPRDQLRVTSWPVNPAATLTLHRSGAADPASGCESIWIECEECRTQLHLTQIETPVDVIERFRATHPCAADDEDGCA